VRFRDDTRGVTVQVGAVLLFATIIIALSVYQATVVPSENADVEYRHSQQVQGQLVDVRNALVATAETGNARPTTVSLGTEYPNRVFLVNPPPAAGTLRTDTYDDPTMQVSNVEATNPETRDYLAGSWSQSTKSLSFVPGYHEYRDAPQLRYEASLLSNYYPEQNTSVPLTDQLLVDEETRTVSLVALNGSLGTSRSSSVAVSPEALSAPAERVQVQPRNPGQPVNVTVPTVIEASVLRNSTDLGDDPNVTVVQNGTQRVTLSVDWSGPFTLRTAKVGVGSDATDAPPHYLTLVETDDDSVTVEARDEYNNPESGVAVSVSGTSPFDSTSEVTGEDGRATFEVEDGEETTATLEILGGGSAEREVDVTVDTATGAAGNGSGGSAAYLVNWLEDRSDDQNAGLTCDGEGCTLDASVQSSVTLFADSTPRVDGGNFTYEVENQSVGEMSTNPGTTDETGESTTTFNANADGTTYVYVSGGGSGDRVELTVENTTGGGGGPGSTPVVSFRLDDLSHLDQSRVEYVGSYSVSNTNSSFERVEIEYENTADGSATQTRQKEGERGGLRYTSTYGAGQTYDVTVQVIYSDGGSEYVAATQTVTDIADARNPATNEDLATGSTATLDSSTIEDRSNNGQGPRYRFDYTVSGAGGYSETELVVVSTGLGDKANTTNTARSGSNIDLNPGYGYQNEFKLAVLVYGPDGAVVDDRILTDDADGTDP